MDVFKRTLFDLGIWGVNDFQNTSKIIEQYTLKNIFVANYINKTNYLVSDKEVCKKNKNFIIGAVLHV